MTSPFTGPALAVLELSSLARGVVVADALVKRARVQLDVAEAVSPGKYLLVFTGAVAEVEESFSAGVEAGGALIVDRLFLPHVAEAVPAALRGALAEAGLEQAAGIVEAQTVAATLRAADHALKCAQVSLTRLQLARGIGGKGWFMLAGLQHDVEAALYGVRTLLEAHLLVGTELIARPHPEVRGRIVT